MADPTAPVPTPYHAPPSVLITVAVAGLDEVIALLSQLVANTAAVNDNIITYGETLMADFSKVNQAATDLVSAVTENASQTHSMTDEVHGLATQIQQALQNGADQATIDGLAEQLVTATGNLKANTGELADDMKTLSATVTPATPPIDGATGGATGGVAAAGAGDGGVVNAGGVAASGDTSVAAGLDPNTQDGTLGNATSTPGS